ncbi:Na+/melibiose symporter [Asanoa hainanensis]|uniref:Na+/melibiose symporter n=1 Tax=Asanoa hainanensis TaxID=560556 RepID=A0A239P1Z6_9ACTN|nr:MFS transporter [Asanoa hainanensis]SNT60753.1 Na+/melibiose symporter [Asanoa hainanensis]
MKRWSRSASSWVPRLSPRAWLVLGGDAISALGSGLTLPFLLVYLHQVRGIGLGVAGLMLSTVALAGLVGNPAGGWLADRIGARRAVIAGLVVAAAGAVALALVHTVWQGFAATFVYGVGMAALLPAQDALLATTVSAAQRPQVFAVRHATLNVGLSVGTVLGALIVSFQTPSTFVLLFLLDAASFLVFAAVLARLADVRVDATAPSLVSGSYRDVLRDRLFLRMWVLVFLLVMAGYAQYHAAFPAYATSIGGLSPRVLGLAFAANMVTVVVAQLVVLRLMTGRRRTRGIALAAAFMATAWAVTLFAGWQAVPLLFVAAMVLFGIGETLVSPTVPAIVNDLAPDALRGRYNGAYALAWTVGYIGGPGVAGLVIAAGHGQGLFAVLIATLGVVALLAWSVGRRLPVKANLIDATS